ncbi:MAG: glycosyltransferase family 2 protein, partial [Rhodanobacteraceae bacterium]|nr:glycosyltransferase family 2 protein [Rhodanobacteraceae bacterium]
MSAELSREKLTIVVPVFNEEVVLPAVCRRLAEVADELPIAQVEIIIVSDGSSDRSNELIRAMVAHDPRFQGLFLARNFGHQAAVSIGLAHASGDYVAVIDGDLQDPPELIAELLRVVTAGADVAYAVRRRRKEGLIKRALYASFYRLLRRIADIPIPLDSGDFCCMRRRVLDAMLTLPERNRFVRGIRAWVGFKQVPVEYERSARFATGCWIFYIAGSCDAVPGLCNFGRRRSDRRGLFCLVHARPPKLPRWFRYLDHLYLATCRCPAAVPGIDRGIPDPSRRRRTRAADRDRCRAHQGTLKTMDAAYGANYRQLYKTHWWWRARERILRRTLKSLPLPAGAEILDFGCGDALSFAMLGDFGNVRGIEVDVNLI